MKKLTALLLLMIIMALCVALVGCDDDETESSSQGGNSTSGVDSTKDSTMVDGTADDGSFGADFSNLLPPSFEFPDEEV